jgi:phosphate transport system protein
MAERGRHIRSGFDAALDALKNDVLMMSSLTERLLENAFHGALQRDSALCNLAIADDQEIDVLEKQVDQGGVDLLIRYQPVSVDMREIISAMKVSANLERIADQGVTIGRRGKRLNQEGMVPEVALIEPLYRVAISIFRDSLRAFADGNADLALELKPRDRELDLLNSDMNEKLIARMSEQPDRVGTYMNLIFIARSLERIGDHATNIAEDAFWVEQAEDIRHTYGAKQEES